MDALDGAADVRHDLANVLGADDRRRRARERLASPAGELLVPAHRVLELGAVCLDDIAHAARCPHGAAEQDVVDEDEVGRAVLTYGGCIRLDPGVELGSGAVLNAFHRVPLVLVHDEDGQEAVHVRPHGRGAAEVEASRIRILREDGHLVALAAPLARELSRVDVRAGPCEQVPVPEVDPHAWISRRRGRT